MLTHVEIQQDERNARFDGNTKKRLVVIVERFKSKSSSSRLSERPTELPPAGDSFKFNWMLAYSQNTVDFLIVWKLKKSLQHSVVSSSYLQRQ